MFGGLELSVNVPVVLMATSALAGNPAMPAVKVPAGVLTASPLPVAPALMKRVGTPSATQCPAEQVSPSLHSHALVQLYALASGSNDVGRATHVFDAPHISLAAQSVSSAQLPDAAH